jgi:tetratricopeptide (TPR) repeat protein
MFRRSPRIADHIAAKRHGAALVLLWLSLLSTGVTAQGIEVQSLPHWELLNARQQSLLGSGDGNDVFASFLDLDDVDDIFSISLIAEAQKARVPDLVPRYLLAAEDRSKAREILHNASRLLMLENRLDSALELALQMREYIDDQVLLLWIAELQYRRGEPGLAKSSLSGYLRGQTQAASEQYFQALYLLARILIDEGQFESAYDLLKSRITAERLGGDPGYYVLRSARLLLELTRSTWARDRNIAGDEILESIVAAYPDTEALPDAFPDPAILSLDLSGPSLIPALAAEVPESPDPPASTENAPSIVSGSTGLIQLGSFSREANARAMVQRLDEEEGLPAFAYSGADSSSDGQANWRVLLDPADSRFEGTENFRNPRRLLLVLKERGIEGFLIEDPR